MSCLVLSVLPILSCCVLSCLAVGKNMGKIFYLILSCSIAMACILLLFLFIGGNMGRSSVLSYLYNMCRSSVLSLFMLWIIQRCVLFYLCLLCKIFMLENTNQLNKFKICIFFSLRNCILQPVPDNGLVQHRQSHWVNLHKIQTGSRDKCLCCHQHPGSSRFPARLRCGSGCFSVLYFSVSVG